MAYLGADPRLVVPILDPHPASHLENELEHALEGGRHSCISIPVGGDRFGATRDKRTQHV
jgi:hypothetical protein